jgi:D-methionine transport system ATP-binding protein
MLATTLERVIAIPAISRAAVPSLITVEDVSKVYPSSRGSAPVTALSDVSLSVPQGAIYGIIGRSGAGKSTLLRLLNGLERPTSGRVVVDGAEVSTLPERSLRGVRRRAGMIFQNFNLLSSRTVFENAALPLELAGAKKDAIAKRVALLLDLVGLADKKNRYPAELSGGQKQRVGIARALATEPAVLLCDEATSALDPETTQSILGLLKELNGLTGVTIVLITHEMQVIKSICGHVAVLDSGEVIEKGPVYQVFAHPKSEVTQRFVAEVTGGALPDDLAKDLSPVQGPRRQAVLRIVFTGQHANAPILSRLSRLLDADVTILSGQVDRIGGEPFGNLLVTVPARDGIVEAAIRLVQSHGLRAEALGYAG